MNLVRDVRYAVRQLARAPGFTTVAVLTLAFGIGVNATLFSVLNGIVMRPLPRVHDQSRLVWVHPVRMSTGNPHPMSPRDFRDFRERTDVFADAAAVEDAFFALANDTGEPQRVMGQIVTGNFFSVLGVRMALGRTFTPAEDRVHRAAPVAVISHRLWRNRFGGDSTVIGRHATINGTGFTIVGVSPDSFSGTSHRPIRDLWIPPPASPPWRETSRQASCVPANESPPSSGRCAAATGFPRGDTGECGCSASRSP